LQAIEINKLVTENFLLSNQFSLWQPQYDTLDRNHKFSLIPVDKAIDFLSKFKFGNFEDSARKSATIRYINYLSSEHSSSFSNICFIQMAYKSDFRERKYDYSTNKIDQLFSGRSTSGNLVYPGDRDIKIEDTICIQIHKVKLKCDQTTKLIGKTIYTLAIYYPEDFASGYISNFENSLDFEQEEDEDDE